MSNLRLTNWGLYYQHSIGLPRGCPTETAMTRGAKKSDWSEPGWADTDGQGKKIDSAPESITYFNEADAVACNDIIATLPAMLQAALVNKYAVKVFRFKALETRKAFNIKQGDTVGAAYINAQTAHAEELFANLSKTHPNKKTHTLVLLESMEPTPNRNQAIADMVGCGIRHVQKMAKQWELDRKAIKSKMFHMKQNEHNA